MKCDVLVVGSGAAGLAAALAAAKHGLKVVVVEKEPYYGGTTAISAGWAWVPGNRQGVELGDTRTAIYEYLRQIAPAHFDAEGVEAFLDTVPEAISFLEDEAGVQFIYPPKAPDYQMDKTGAKESGRAIIPTDVDARILGPDRLKVQPYLSSYTVFGYMPQVGADITHFFRVNQSLRSFVYVASRLLRTWWDTLWFRRPLTRSNGNALITQMLKAAKDAGVGLRTSAPVERLITDGRLSIKDWTGSVKYLIWKLVSIIRWLHDVCHCAYVHCFLIGCSPFCSHPLCTGCHLVCLRTACHL